MTDNDHFIRALTYTNALNKIDITKNKEILTLADLN